MTSVAVCDADGLAERVAALGRLLHDCVHAGASIGFVLPFTRSDAEDYWGGGVQPRVRDGACVLLVAEQDGMAVGSVQLDLSTPANQSHRAGIAKLLVHPEHRRQGLARSLMTALEEEARRCGRSLLTLDTVSGSAAEPLYASMGYVRVGEIPSFARHAIEDRLEPTTIMYKAL